MSTPFFRIAYKAIRTLITPFELYRLGKSNSDVQHSLADSIRKAGKPDFSNEEIEWINKIESERTRLLATDETIQIDNFVINDSQMRRAYKSEMEKVSDVCSASINSSYGRLLHKLVRNTSPLKCLELGTSLGISTAFIASAILLNGTGHLVTLEGSKARSSYAELLLKSMDLQGVDFVTGPFQQSLEALLESSYQGIDFCFIDGHHDGKSTNEYFDRISRVLNDGSIVVIDDVTWSDDMQRAWNTIKNKEQVILSVDTYMMGICLIGKNRKIRKKKREQAFKIMYW